MKRFYTFLFFTALLFASRVFGQLPGSVILDKDSNAYHTVSIGTQLWMVENLRSTSYNDGTPIPLVKDNLQWSKLISPAYCWYNNDEKRYKELYGALYNWYTVNTGKLCPEGWHVPTENDWTQLITSLTQSGETAGALKEESAAHWLYPNYGASNHTGFTARAAGARQSYMGNFYIMGSFAYWWGVETYEKTKARAFSLSSGSDSLNITYENEKNGFSVRCMRDQKSGQRVSMDGPGSKWIAYVPPANSEDILPPYDRWLPLMECYDQPSCGPFTKDSNASRMYLFLVGVLPDGSFVTLFQLDHLVYINSETGEIIKKVW